MVHQVQKEKAASAVKPSRQAASKQMSQSIAESNAWVWSLECWRAESGFGFVYQTSYFVIVPASSDKWPPVPCLASVHVAATRHTNKWLICKCVRQASITTYQLLILLHHTLFVPCINDSVYTSHSTRPCSREQYSAVEHFTSAVKEVTVVTDGADVTDVPLLTAQSVDTASHNLCMPSRQSWLSSATTTVPAASHHKGKELSLTVYLNFFTLVNFPTAMFPELYSYSSFDSY